METSKNHEFLLFLVNFSSFKLYFWPFHRLFSDVNRQEINSTLNPDYSGHWNGLEMLKNTTAMSQRKIGRKKIIFFHQFLKIHISGIFQPFSAFLVPKCIYI